ncbi:MAG: hypothetical protein GEU73_01585 [Chloroflexi bacterium]|nr:hypothetical protein [Chloroflexota bacterium]
MNGFVAQLGARQSVGFTRDVRACPLTHPVPYPGDDEHEGVKLLGLLEELGVGAQGTHLELPLTPEDVADAVSALGCCICRSGRPLVGIHPGAKAPARRWPPERYAAVADMLQTSLGAEIVLLWGPGEEPLTRVLRDAMVGEALISTRAMSVGGLAATISELDLLLCNDSGPAHVAEALGVRSVVLFGPGNLRRWGPLDRERHRVLYRRVPCSLCGYTTCPIDHRCLDGITVEEVVDAAREQLRHAARR